MGFSRSLIGTAAACALALSAMSAHAIGCSPNFADGGQSPSFGDLSGVTVTQCAGFYQGNALNSGNQTALSLVNSILTSPGWGLASVTGWIEKYDTNNSAINFSTMLYGDTVVAFHWGNFPGGGAGNVSALYRFNAGTAGVDVFSITAGAQGLSNAAVFVTSVTAVPEPETYALLLAGLGLVGFMAKRRRAQA